MQGTRDKPCYSEMLIFIGMFANAHPPNKSGQVVLMSLKSATQGTIICVKVADKLNN